MAHKCASRTGFLHSRNVRSTSRMNAARAVAKRMDRNVGNVATSVTATNLEDMKTEIRQAAQAGADIVELRLDYLESIDEDRDIDALVKCCELPTIATFRPAWEGGQYQGAEDYRLAVLKRAADAGCTFIDVELKVAEEFLKTFPKESLEGTGLILSRHDFERTPPAEELQAWVAQAWDIGADVVKIATTAQTITDVRQVIDLLQKKRGRTIALSMGDHGQISRLLASKFGAFLTFGSLEKGKESAPGQTTVKDLVSVYRIHQQNEDTQVFGLIGNPVSHSKGPVLHNASMQSIGFDGVYVPFLVDDVDAFLSAFPEFSGFSVTIPHKQSALKYGVQHGDVDVVAQKIGALNTLVRLEDGSLYGCNTDYLAAIKAIENALRSIGHEDLKGKNVVVVGAGGAGRAIAFGAKEKGANVTVVNRSKESAEKLAADVGCSVRGLDELLKGEIRGDVLANTTSVGMYPNVEHSPVPAKILPGFLVVFDAVYNPKNTRLLQDASAAGCAIANGVDMFVGQAAEQFALFTKTRAPVELMAEVVASSLQ